VLEGSGQTEGQGLAGLGGERRQEALRSDAVWVDMRTTPRPWSPTTRLWLLRGPGRGVCVLSCLVLLGATRCKNWFLNIPWRVCVELYRTMLIPCGALYKAGPEGLLFKNIHIILLLMYLYVNYYVKFEIFLHIYMFITAFIIKFILFYILKNQTMNRWTNGSTGKNLNR
jgi:hypothetical protein